MTHGIVITDGQLEAAYMYMNELYEAFDFDETKGMTEEEKLERLTACAMWKGARRVLRRLGIRTSDLDNMFYEREEGKAI